MLFGPTAMGTATNGPSVNKPATTRDYTCTTRVFTPTTARFALLHLPKRKYPNYLPGHSPVQHFLKHSYKYPARFSGRSRQRQIACGAARLPCFLQNRYDFFHTGVDIYPA